MKWIVLMISLLLSGCLQSLFSSEPQPLVEEEWWCEDENNNPTPGNWDWDGDLLSNDYEIHLYGTDPCSADTDNDTLSDHWELFNSNTDPLSNDTDNDTLLDPDDPSPLDNESDFDGDGVLDQFDINMTHDELVRVSLEYNITGGELSLAVFRWDGSYSLGAWNEVSGSSGGAAVYGWDDSEMYLNISIYIGDSWMEYNGYYDIGLNDHWEYYNSDENNSIEFSITTEAA